MCIQILECQIRPTMSRFDVHRVFSSTNLLLLQENEHVCHYHIDFHSSYCGSVESKDVFYLWQYFFHLFYAIHEIMGKKRQQMGH